VIGSDRRLLAQGPATPFTSERILPETNGTASAPPDLQQVEFTTNVRVPRLSKSAGIIVFRPYHVAPRM